jgi:predicted nucleic acid-binding protein
MEEVFVDSGAFVALLSQSDKNHERALEIYKTLTDQRVRLVTTNHVIDETCTWLLYHARNGHAKAVEFGVAMAGGTAQIGLVAARSHKRLSNGLLIIYSSPEIENEAWNLFRKYDTTGFSFTDCVSFALMQAMNIRQSFAFDSHFDILGFERL